MRSVTTLFEEMTQPPPSPPPKHSLLFHVAVGRHCRKITKPDKVLITIVDQIQQPRVWYRIVIRQLLLTSKSGAIYVKILHSDFSITAYDEH